MAEEEFDDDEGPCGHGKMPDEWCETCDGDARDDDQEVDECTCARGPVSSAVRAELEEQRGRPCPWCGMLVR